MVYVNTIRYRNLLKLQLFCITKIKGILQNYRFTVCKRDQVSEKEVFLRKKYKTFCIHYFSGNPNKILKGTVSFLEWIKLNTKWKISDIKKYIKNNTNWYWNNQKIIKIKIYENILLHNKNKDLNKIAKRISLLLQRRYNKYYNFDSFYDFKKLSDTNWHIDDKYTNKDNNNNIFILSQSSIGNLGTRYQYAPRIKINSFRNTLIEDIYTKILNLFFDKFKKPHKKSEELMLTNIPSCVYHRGPKYNLKTSDNIERILLSFDSTGYV